MSMEHTATKPAIARNIRSQFREKVRKAEIFAWYLCYRVLTSANKEHPGKSLNN